MHNGVKSPIFYGYKNQDPWIFKIWVFETEKFFAQVHLSNDKQRMWYSKTRVAGRALEYWNYYERLHFRFHWSQITWERMKEDLCIEYFSQYFHKDLQQPSHGNLQDQKTSMRQCNNAQLTHEVSTIRQDLEDLMQKVQELSLQMNPKVTQRDSIGVSKMTSHNEITDSHIEDNVGNGILVMKGDQVLPDPDFDKEVEASLLEESSMIHADLEFDKVEKVDTPIPLFEFVIPEKFHEVEYKVDLYSVLPKTIP